MKIPFRDIEHAFLCTGSGSNDGNTVTLNRYTGEMYYESEYMDSDELPDDIGDEKYIELPDKIELNLGKRLVFEFVSTFLPEKLDKVEDIFRRKGAYARYKDLLEYEGKLDEWYRFEDEAQERALRKWREENEIDISG